MNTLSNDSSRPVSPLKLLPESQLIFIFVILGLLLSAWRIHIAELVNNDGAAYLLAASGDWSQAAIFKNWNFYSLLVGWLSRTVSVSPELAAHLCNAIFDTVTLLFFLRVVVSFGGDRLTVMWAGIAFLSLVYFNDNRSEVIRGHGYWAAYMVGLWYFIRLFRAFCWRTAAGWTAAMLVACLFRVEAVAFLLLAPIGLLANTAIAWPMRMRSLLGTWAPLILIAITLFFTFGVIGSFQDRLLELTGYAGHLLHEITTVMPEKAEALREHVFPYHKDEESLQGVYIFLGWSVVRDIIKGLSPFFFLLLIMRGWFPRPGLSQDSGRIIWAFILVNLVVMLSWTLAHQVMVARYALGFVFVAFVWVAFSLAHLHRRVLASKKGARIRVGFKLVLGVIVVMLADSIIETGPKKTYLLDAGNWIQSNLPEDSRISASHERQRLRYYANKGLSKQPTYAINATVAANRKNLDYLLIRLRKGQLVGVNDIAELEKDMTRVQQFVDHSGNGIALYGR